MLFNNADIMKLQSSFSPLEAKRDFAIWNFDFATAAKVDDNKMQLDLHFRACTEYKAPLLAFKHYIICVRHI